MEAPRGGRPPNHINIPTPLQCDVEYLNKDSIPKFYQRSYNVNSSERYNAMKEILDKVLCDWHFLL